MFTVEEEFDESVVTVMDTKANFEDVKMHFQEDVIYIAQYDKEFDTHDVVKVSTEMWELLIEAYNRTHGTYIVTRNGT